jgi:uncharacterized protein YqjF (DUF2071 family)
MCCGKRKAEHNGEYSGGIGPCSTAAVVDGSWLTPEKRVRTRMKVVLHYHLRSDGDDWKIAAADLAMTLEADALMLIGYGECFRFVARE